MKDTTIIKYDFEGKHEYEVLSVVGNKYTLVMVNPITREHIHKFELSREDFLWFIEN